MGTQKITKPVFVKKKKKRCVGSGFGWSMQNPGKVPWKERGIIESFSLLLKKCKNHMKTFSQRRGKSWREF